MSGGPMRTTNEALKIFIQSLPIGSQFSILRFGSSSEYVLNQQIWEYSDKTMNQMLVEIGRISADLGGTNILAPLKKAVD